MTPVDDICATLIVLKAKLHTMKVYDTKSNSCQTLYILKTRLIYVQNTYHVCIQIGKTSKIYTHHENNMHMKTYPVCVYVYICIYFFFSTEQDEHEYKPCMCICIFVFFVS